MLLDNTDLLHMRAQIHTCNKCLQQILKNYCRECDEFFSYGHGKPCNSVHDHEGHRTY